MFKKALAVLGIVFSSMVFAGNPTVVNVVDGGFSLWCSGYSYSTDGYTSFLTVDGCDMSGRFKPETTDEVIGEVYGYDFSRSGNPDVAGLLNHCDVHRMESVEFRVGNLSSGAVDVIDVSGCTNVDVNGLPAFGTLTALEHFRQVWSRRVAGLAPFDLMLVR